jgi:hypothetical protein
MRGHLRDSSVQVVINEKRYTEEAQGTADGVELEPVGVRLTRYVAMEWIVSFEGHHHLIHSHVSA